MNKFYFTFLYIIANFNGYCQTTTPLKPDYNNINCWAAHPFKADLSDNQPKNIAGKYPTDTSVDVFFIHPTSYTDKNNMGQSASVYDDKLNSKTDEGSIQFQASVFNSSARIFAPRYRQAHLSSFYPITKEDSMAAATSFIIAYEDVKEAFEFYLKNYNNGRPIIIASHSQGTVHAKKLLKDYFDDKALQPQLVAAYLIGFYVPTDYFTQIPTCNKPNSTGCAISWRTFEYNYTPLYATLENKPAIVTNPLTWDIDKPTATKEENKGILKSKFNKVLVGLVDANVQGNVLWVTKPNIFGIGILNKNYHIADYNFFYINIKENIAERVKAFWDKRKY